MPGNKQDILLFLDIDDTLLRFDSSSPAHEIGLAAPYAPEFVLWALEHFEVRWLTMWCPCGILEEHRAKELSGLFGGKVTTEQFLAIRNPRNFFTEDSMLKTNGIDFTDTIPWVWVEDNLLKSEIAVLDEHKMYNRWIKCNVSKDPKALYWAWESIANRFQLEMPV